MNRKELGLKIVEELNAELDEAKKRNGDNPPGIPEIHLPRAYTGLGSGSWINYKDSDKDILTCQYCECSNAGDEAGRCLACGAPLPKSHNEYLITLSTST